MGVLLIVGWRPRGHDELRVKYMLLKVYFKLED